MVYATIQALLSKKRDNNDHIEDKPSGLKSDTATTESVIENQKWNPGLFGTSKQGSVVIDTAYLTYVRYLNLCWNHGLECHSAYETLQEET